MAPLSPPPHGRTPAPLGSAHPTWLRSGGVAPVLVLLLLWVLVDSMTHVGVMRGNAVPRGACARAGAAVAPVAGDGGLEHE